MRSRASILHLDLDAFFASVEQRDKPSLRGKPVVVGGIGNRGVVSTASYEARVFGVRSAMPTGEARRKAPHAAYLTGRFAAYRLASRQVMDVLASLSPLVEPLSLDEAFVDLEASPEPPGFTTRELTDYVTELKRRVAEITGGLTCSVGVGSSKFMAKLATELGKPDGCRIVEPGTEVELIAPTGVRAIPGVGPVTMERLLRLGAHTIGDLQKMSLSELCRELGKSSGAALHELAFARDDRPVEVDREAKSISVEDTFEHDERDPERIRQIVTRDARLVASRVRAAGLFARTITCKVRTPDFTTYTRSRTLDGATDRGEVIARIAQQLIDGIDATQGTRAQGIRLLGVGVAGLTEIAQEELFDSAADELPGPDDTGPGDPASKDPASKDPAGSVTADDAGVIEDAAEVVVATTGAVPDSISPGAAGEDLAWQRRRPVTYAPGVDVEHTEHGRGWVWGAGRGRVTVRFETAETGPGPVRTFAEDDPELSIVEFPPPE